jgi:arylsulfatase A-like enzyme
MKDNVRKQCEVLLPILSFFGVGMACAADKPNIIVILSDDQGWADIGYNNAKVFTPNLDKLAAGGATFKSHYVMPQCTPSRVAAITGRFPGRFGNQGLSASNAQQFSVGTPTLATLLKKCGYKTYMVGKWHLGTDFADGPNHHGFDESYGSMAGGLGMYDHRYRPGRFEETWHRNLKLIEGRENGIHVTDLVSREAVRVIEKERNEPFFLYLAFHAPHTPLDERGEFVSQPTQRDPENPNRWLNEDKIQWFNDPEGIIQQEPDAEKRLFLAAVYHLDYAIGEIVAAIERSGQRNKTLILFSSDNGPQGNWPGSAYPDDLILTDFNQALPMRGLKTDVWEGGIHVAGFANWPGHIEPKVITEATHIVDWLPTIMSIVGQPSSLSADSDGLDLSPLIFDAAALPERDLYWTWHSETSRWALRFGDWKIVRYALGEPAGPEAWQLFNLQTDPREETNIAAQHQEIVTLLHNRFLVQRGKDKSVNNAKNAKE